ncbi:hypothetical protein ACEE90_03625 [Corynebacterium phoceense]
MEHSITLKAMRETHQNWFTRVTRGDSNRHVSDLAGISAATLGRQLRDNTLSADLIIKIATAYDESPVIALVDLGFISARWLHDVGTTTALSKATDEELTDELLRRLRLIGNEPVDELAARREAGAHVGTPDYDDGTVREFDYDPSEYAADSSPNEQKEREKRGEDPID